MPQAPAPQPEKMLALLRGVSRSFYVSIRLLPAPLRRPVALAYLLARATDTLADTADLPASERPEKLEALAAAIDGRLPAPIMAASLASTAHLQHDLAERNLILALPWCLSRLDELGPADRDDVRAVLRHITYGQALDIERFAQGAPPMALQTAAQLDEYTYLVAGCVGEFWTELCFRHLPAFARLPKQRMRELGRDYGMGLQLVNILRDAGSDLAAGRCYFPADELAAAGLRPQEILSDPARFEVVWNRWCALSQHRLDLGMRYADAVRSRRVRAASALPALVGARTLALLRVAGPQRLHHKVKVPRREVRWMMARLLFTFAGRAPLRDLFGRLQGRPSGG
jgi:farnesyl-diphosphate farnesyltransferase